MLSGANCPLSATYVSNKTRWLKENNRINSLFLKNIVTTSTTSFSTFTNKRFEKSGTSVSLSFSQLCAFIFYVYCFSFLNSV